MHEIYVTRLDISLPSRVSLNFRRLHTPLYPGLFIIRYPAYFLVINSRVYDTINLEIEFPALSSENAMFTSACASQRGNHAINIVQQYFNRR